MDIYESFSLMQKFWKDCHQHPNCNDCEGNFQAHPGLLMPLSTMWQTCQEKPFTETTENLVTTMKFSINCRINVNKFHFFPKITQWRFNSIFFSLCNYLTNNSYMLILRSIFKDAIYIHGMYHSPIAQTNSNYSL